MPSTGSPDVQLAWTTAAVARRLGVATSTLRTWSRRYGLGPAEHDFGRHRRYEAADIARLSAMRTLVAQGMAPAAAARWVQSRTPDELEAPAGSPDGDEPRRAPPARQIRALIAAATRLDTDAVAGALSAHLTERGVLDTWNQLCLPVLAEIGQNVEDVGCIAVEHGLSWAMTGALHRVPAPGPLPGARTALLACAENEQHTLALDALRAALTTHRTPVRMLGASTPGDALTHAVRRTEPGAVVLWAQMHRTARPSQLTRLGQIGSTDTVLVAAGPGWSTRRLPAAITRADSLQAALLLALGATRPPR